MTAPAAMPGEEEIKDLLLRFHADTASAWRHERDGIATFAARAILSLFAPILAEKERLVWENGRLAVEADRNEVGWNVAEARALAAEAALAAERERCAKIAEDYGRRARDSRQPSTMTNALVLGCEHIAAAIRTQGE